jgi:hypothetical protein
MNLQVGTCYICKRLLFSLSVNHSAHFSLSARNQTPSVTGCDNRPTHLHFTQTCRFTEEPPYCTLRRLLTKIFVLVSVRRSSFFLWRGKSFETLWKHSQVQVFSSYLKFIHPNNEFIPNTIPVHFSLCCKELNWQAINFVIKLVKSIGR